MYIFFSMLNHQIAKLLESQISLNQIAEILITQLKSIYFLMHGEEPFRRKTRSQLVDE
jgi:hypothetical protein